MMWDLSKIRNITLMDRVLKAVTFARIGPNNEAGKALKERINAHLSSEDENEGHLLELVEAIDRDFLLDYQCEHQLMVSERNSECARRRGQKMITDCTCRFCEGVNEVWLADEWGSGLPLAFPLDDDGSVVVKSDRPIAVNEDGSVEVMAVGDIPTPASLLVDESTHTIVSHSEEQSHAEQPDAVQEDEAEEDDELEERQGERQPP